MMILLCAAGVLGPGVWVLFRIGAAAGAQPRAFVAKVPNPHWKKDTCDVCHAGQGEQRHAIAPEAIDDLCVKCHDGTQASQEFHPVSRKFKETDLITMPKGWPVVNGELACMTCHEIAYACDLKRNTPASNRKFLRDFRQGRAMGQPFCQNCHKESAYRKINPHEMLLETGAPALLKPSASGARPVPSTQPAGGPEVIEEKCLFCHTKPLDRKTMKRTGEASLKTGELALCRDCHPRHKDPMMQNHIGLPIKPEMLALMCVREQTGLAGNPDPTILEQVQAARTRPRLLVPADDNTMTCSTCHNPHQRWVFPPGSELGYRAMQVSPQKKLVSPVHEPVWCRHCHGM
jgi:hypothetical protein